MMLILKTINDYDDVNFKIMNDDINHKNYER